MSENEVAPSRTFSVRVFRDGDEHGILALFNRVFAIGNPDFEPRPLSHWRWQFAANPEGHATMVAESEGQIVGTYTAIPARVRFPDGQFRLGQSVDTVVAPEFRRSLKKSGVFLTLVHAWYDQFLDKSKLRFIYGFANPEAHRVGVRLAGYEPIHCPLPELELPLADVARWQREAIHVEEIERLGGELGAFDAALAPRVATRMGVASGAATIRDARHWNWRYADHPAIHYRLLRAESASGELRGFLVHGLSWHAFRKEIVPIVDWVIAPGDRATWRALLGDAAHAAARASAAASSPKLTTFLTWAPPPNPHRADLESIGFQTRGSIFNYCIRRVPGSDYTAEQARDNLALTMGDSDIY